ncbi:hypothetical protein LPJ57_011195 [Coemansia sp. RSA 486]|nr:hypothetical protein LPJ57_011195 [Coemansia sp. RSA 486]
MGESAASMVFWITSTLSPMLAESATWARLWAGAVASGDDKDAAAHMEAGEVAGSTTTPSERDQSMQ